MKKNIAIAFMALSIASATGISLSSCSDDVEELKSTAQTSKVTLQTNQLLTVRNDSFPTNWENMESVAIFTDHQHQGVYLPWAGRCVTSLPSSIRNDMKKENGWEMAFSLLDDENASDCNYFGLYNRYLGILRIFHYVSNSSTGGSKYSFEVNLGEPSVKNKLPFYHSLAYGIPASHKDSLSTTLNLLGDGANTFKSYFSPYTSMSSTALSLGWTAFDIDMSAYSPEANWLSSEDAMSIFCKSQNVQSVTLAGTLEANLTGKYSSTEQSASSSGVSGLLKSAGSLIGDVQNSALTSIESFVTGSFINTYFRYAGTVCNVAAYAWDYMTGSGTTNLTDSMPGKIEMSMTGDINLDGYISNLTSNSVPPLTMKAKCFEQNSNVGKGVWSLAQDPVVYLVDDRILGDSRRFYMTVDGNGTYGNSSVANSHLRMATFFDPTSVKVNINPEVFPDASDVKVSCDYGVYCDEANGHTSQYVQMLKLSRPTLQIVKDGEQTKVYASTAASNKTKYVYLPHTDLISDEAEETEENCSLVQQNGADYYYYGRKMTNEGKSFILSPQVYLPYTVGTDCTKIYDGQMPDFVTVVTVVFKSQGRTFMFSQRFLPKVVKINAADLNAKYSELAAYADKCKNGLPCGTVEQRSSVPVTHYDGNGGIYKTLKMLKAILNN